MVIWIGRLHSMLIARNYIVIEVIVALQGDTSATRRLNSHHIDKALGTNRHHFANDTAERSLLYTQRQESTPVLRGSTTRVHFPHSFRFWVQVIQFRWGCAPLALISR